jgi:hypothetical protein
MGFVRVLVAVVFVEMSQASLVKDTVAALLTTDLASIREGSPVLATPADVLGLLFLDYLTADLGADFFGRVGSLAGLDFRHRGGLY